MFLIKKRVVDVRGLLKLPLSFMTKKNILICRNNV